MPACTDELQLGVPLLERGRRGVQPSAAGFAALHHAKGVLHHVDLMHSDLGEFAKGLRGQIRLMSNTGALTEFLPPILSAFLTAHPTVDVEVIERPSQDIPRALMERKAEIGIMANTADMTGLQTFPFREDKLVVITPPGHPLIARGNTNGGASFADIISNDFVGLADGSALQEHLISNAARIGRRLKLRVRLRSFDVICQTVERDVDISIMPQGAAERCSRMFNIGIVSLTDHRASRELRICLRNSDDLPVYGRRLVEALRQ